MNISGSTGEVVLGTHKGRNVAVKRIRDTKSAHQLLENEVRILRALDACPHVIRLLDIVEAGDGLFPPLVLAYGGVDILNCMGTCAWTRLGMTRKGFVQHCFSQLLSAVAYLHSRRVVHRDLKVENAVVDDDATVRLIDFGVSHVFTTDTQASLTTAVGTEQYAAPEVWCGHTKDAYKADVWSMGVLLYVMAAAAYPYASYRSVCQLQALGTPPRDCLMPCDRLSSVECSVFDVALVVDVARRVDIHGARALYNSLVVEAEPSQSIAR